MNNIQKALENGQSIWLDSISRDMLRSGELQKFIDSGITGVTSNPSIFDKMLVHETSTGNGESSSVSYPASAPRSPLGLADS